MCLRDEQQVREELEIPAGWIKSNYSERCQHEPDTESSFALDTISGKTQTFEAVHRNANATETEEIHQKSNSLSLFRPVLDALQEQRIRLYQSIGSAILYE